MNEYLTTEEFAEIARTNPSTIRYWRHVGHGPTGFKLGRRVLYIKSEVLDWINQEREDQQNVPA